MVIRPNNTSSSLEVEVPRQTSWHTPQGSYSGSIRSVKVIPRFGGDSSCRIVRITFNLNVPLARLDYLAKVDLKLDLTEGSDLWNLICNLINRKALQDSSGSTFDLQKLVGLACDVVIEHNTGQAQDYAFPLVLVTDVRELGRLVKTECKAESCKTTDREAGV